MPGTLGPAGGRAGPLTERAYSLARLRAGKVRAKPDVTSSARSRGADPPPVRANYLGGRGRTYFLGFTGRMMSEPGTP